MREYRRAKSLLGGQAAVERIRGYFAEPLASERSTPTPEDEGTWVSISLLENGEWEAEISEK